MLGYDISPRIQLARVQLPRIQLARVQLPRIQLARVQDQRNFNSTCGSSVWGVYSRGPGAAGPRYEGIFTRGCGGRSPPHVFIKEVMATASYLRIIIFTRGIWTALILNARKLNARTNELLKFSYICIIILKFIVKLSHKERI